MNAREKLLAGLVGAALVFAILFAGWRQVSSLFEARRGQEASLLATIDANESTLRRDAQAAKKLTEYRRRSLPSDSAQANNLYKQWLLEVCHDVGLSMPLVRPIAGRAGDSLGEVRFQVEGDATIEQLTKLLHRYYSSDDLHRIQFLLVNRINDSKNVKVSITTSALTLPQAAARSVVGDLPSPLMKDKPVDRYVSAIVNRNLFGPANQAPTVAANQDQSATVGESLEFTVKASDPDADSLVYAFEGEPPQGFSIDAKKGTIRWRPEQLGDVQLAVRVSDSGMPSLSDSKTLKIVVRDPPPKSEAPGIDDSKFAQMVGVLDSNNERQLWIHVRTKGETLKLIVGDSLHVGTFDGVISSIGLDSAEITTKSGAVSIEVGQMLADARPVAKPIQAAGS